MQPSKVFLAIALCISTGVIAQTPSAALQQPAPSAPAQEAPAAFQAPQQSPVAAEVARLQEEVAVLSARLKIVDYQNQIATKESDMAKAKGGGTYSYGEPVVTFVEEFEGRRSVASLQYPSGMKLTVQEKDALPDGWKVAKIKDRRVTIARNGASKILMFGNVSTYPSLVPQQGIPGAQR